MLKELQAKLLRVSKQTLKKVSRKNYYLARAYGVWNLQVSSPNNQAPLIVFQMGKVGSTTIVRSLRALELDMPIYHVHRLTQEGIDRIESVYKEAFPDKQRIDSHLLASLYLRKRMQAGLGDQKWKVVTLVRDPVARNISSFFQHITIESALPDGEWRLKSTTDRFEIAIKDNNFEELAALFLARYRHDRPLTYFDHEFKNVFDIDFYTTDFPITIGYKIYETPRADILLLRLEDLKDCASDAFKMFLNVDSFKLASGNIGSQKEYADLYRVFKDTICFPEDYLDKMYSSKFAQQFYTEAELKTFRAKWSKKRNAH